MVALGAVPVLAVLFDYGLVLSGPPDPAAWERLKQDLRTEEAPFFAAYWHYRHDYDRGALNSEAYWRRVAQELGQELTLSQLTSLLEADTLLWTQPNEPMIAWAAALQARGIPTGILSNLGDAMECGVLERCPWMQAFTHHTFSHRLGIAKPEAAIYTHAAAGLQTPPAQILFVDDREENIRAAQEAGMQALQYTTHDDFVHALRAAGLGELLKPATNG